MKISKRYINQLETIKSILNSADKKCKGLYVSILKLLDFGYFPIQKLAKMLPNRSSVVTSPVISPK